VFRGVNHLNLDAKGRLTFPSRYRERLQDYCAGEMVITVDPDHCLLVYALPEWEVIEKKLAALPSLKPQNRRLQRLLIGYAAECPMDGAGRILLPPPHREFAGLDKKTVLVGQGNKFELWDEATWNERREVWLAEAAQEMELSTELEELSL
jgi:MraZ protein